MKNYILLIGFLLLSNSTFSQVTLPYSTGFDTASEQAGWVEYKKAATNYTGWSISSTNSQSAPNCLTHDYSPSSGITLADNWFVSPAFEIENGGKLDQISYMFSGYSVPQADDMIAIYLLQGSQDPDMATQVLLFDFRGSDYVADYNYRTKTNIDLPPYNGLSYFAIRYKNSNASSNWLTVHFDDISISGNTGSLNDILSNGINIYPNPVYNELHINTHQLFINSIKIVDNSGRIYFNTKINTYDHIKLDVSKLNNGLYFINIDTKNGLVSKKIIVQK